MDVTRMLACLEASHRYEGQIVHVEDVPPRAARHGALSVPLPQPLGQALAAARIHDLWLHQVRCTEEARAGRNVAVVTGTASGKTLAYTIPVLESLLATPDTQALFLYPTKALAQDQLRGLLRLGQLAPALGETLRTGTYDGDTPAATRRKLRDEANVLLTNPDMLHSGILPYHAKWSRVFARLKWVVLDEIHAYRGIFGSNIANVIRRLRRVARHYGSTPQFLLGSATIANPRELAERLVGDDVVVVDEDGSPRGPKRFVLWNPPWTDESKMGRRGANVEAYRLLVDLVKNRVPTICFSKARVTSELIHRYTQEALEREAPELAGKVRAYRGGYLPAERRAIERSLFSGELLGVSSTNALELGIDVGTLDASIVVGFPGTIASLHQQAGRAGRGREESVTFFVAGNDPIDQYLARHPRWLFAQTPESAVIDPENPYILAGHLECAAFELPFSDEEDGALFGGSAADLVRLLDEHGRTRRVDGKSYWANVDFPSRAVSLRHMSQDTYTIVQVVPDRPNTSAFQPRVDSAFDAPARGEASVLGTVDAISALELLYPEAVYLHDGETFVVRRLDLEGKCAYVERREVDYYTQPVVESHLLWRDTREANEVPGAATALGEASVTWFTSFFKKIRFQSVDSIGWGNLDLPKQTIETVAFSLAPSPEIRAAMKRAGMNPTDGLAGLRNVLITVLPLWAMCDRSDIGGVVDSKNLGRPAVFLYDRYPGGLGFVEHAFRGTRDVLEAACSLVEECPCETGCPSCVGLPVLRPAQHQDPEVGGAWPIPDKDAARRLLRLLLERDGDSQRIGLAHAGAREA